MNRDYTIGPFFILVISTAVTGKEWLRVSIEYTISLN